MRGSSQAWIKMLRKRVSALQRKLSLSSEKPLRTQLFQARLVAGRRDGYIWPARVIFSHVQMTCQLLLNYTRHLDQSAQCQCWLILFIVALMTVPVDTDDHKSTQRGIMKGIGKGGCRDREARARVGWLSGCLTLPQRCKFQPLIIRYTENKWWKSLLFSRQWKRLRA